MKHATTYLLTLLVLFTVSCSKYEDGPAISLRTKTSRLTHHQWKVDRYYENGTDRTSEFYNFMPNYSEVYTSDNKYSYTSSLFSGDGGWVFVDNKSAIRVTLGNDARDQVILKLEIDDLWYYYMDGNDKLEFHMIPQ